MSIRTTVTLDDDVAARLKEESMVRAVPFGKLLNEAVRSGLLAMNAKPPRRKYVIDPLDLGCYPGIDYNNIGGLIELAEGENWR